MAATTYPAKIIAKLFGITERRLQQLVKDGTLPSAGRGEYELAAVVQAYIAHLKEAQIRARTEATQADVAAHLFVDRVRVTQLVSNGVLVKTPGGRLDMDESRRRYVDHLREVAAGRAPGDDDELNLTEERARKAKEEADKLEMENATTRRELLKREDVDAAVVGTLARVRSRLINLPSKIAPLVAMINQPAEAEAIARKAVNEALRELADTKLTSLVGDNGDVVGHSDTTAGSDDKPVGRRKPKAKPRSKRGAGKVGHKPG